jgi:hypothetical protein
MPKASSIRMQFEPDEDGTGKLTVTAAANGFAGVGAAWFNAAELETFASRLSSYPLAVPGPAIAGGFFSREEGGGPSHNGGSRERTSR